MSSRSIHKLNTHTKKKKTLINEESKLQLHSNRIKIEERNSLLMAPPTLRSPSLELGDGTATPSTEEQNGAAIRGSHFPELGSEALVVGISLGAAFPRQAIDEIFGGFGLERVLSLQLEIKLQGLFEALAGRVAASARSGAAAEVGEGGGEGEEEEEGEEVREGEREGEGEGVVGEEEREGVEEVGEVGGEEEGAGEEDEDEDEDVQRGGG